MEWYTLSASMHKCWHHHKQLLRIPTKLSALNHHGKLGAILDEGELIHSWIDVLELIDPVILVQRENQ